MYSDAHLQYIRFSGPRTLHLLAIEPGDLEIEKIESDLDGSNRVGTSPYIRLEKLGKTTKYLCCGIR